MLISFHLLVFIFLHVDVLSVLISTYRVLLPEIIFLDSYIIKVIVKKKKKSSIIYDSDLFLLPTLCSHLNSYGGTLIQLL